MQAIPAPVLRSTVEQNNLTFGPSIDNNTIFSDGAQRLQQGRFARIPIMLGMTDQEIFGNSSASAQGTKIGFTCPTAKSATAHAKYGPTYQYRYYGNFPSQAGLPPLGFVISCLGARLGVNDYCSPFHGSEIALIFGTFNQAIATDLQRENSKYLQKAWTTFAKDPKNGLRKLGWVRFYPADIVKLSC